MRKARGTHRCVGVVGGCAALIVLAVAAAPAAAETTERLDLRGHPQTLHLYGARGGRPVIVSSGDGGWIHLGPQVAEFLGSRGFFVVGFDAKAYLEAFTSKSDSLRPEDEPRDYRTLIAFTARGSAERPVLIGVSEGAGLSVLAATAAEIKPLIQGVIALGLPNRNELGWRWKDSLIYLTHGVPNEPTFSVSEIVGGVAPIPLAAIHSTRDEFVSVTEVSAVLARAATPKRLWVVTARDHRFSDNRAEFETRLMEALTWIRQNRPR